MEENKARESISESFDKLLKEGNKLSEDAGKLKGANNITDKIDTITDSINKLKDILPDDIINDLDEDEKENQEETDEFSELDSEESYSYINPETGETVNTDSKLKDDFKVDSDTKLDKLLNMTQEEIKRFVDIDCDYESVMDSIRSVEPDIELDEKDLKLFIGSLDKYRKGEKFSYYMSLPKPMKDSLDNIIAAEYDISMKKELRNSITKDLFDSVIQDNYINTAFVDLQTSMDESYKQFGKEIKEELSNNSVANRKMAEMLMEKADNIQDENPELADKWRAFSYNFKQAYTYEDMKKDYSTGKYRAKPIEIDKFNRECDRFCSKYKDSKFVINDINIAYTSLVKYLPENTDDKSIKRFIIAFIKYSDNFDITKVEEYTFIYYFIRNIINIGNFDNNNKDEVVFYDTLIDNILDCINEINNIELDIKNKNIKEE